LPLRGRKRKGSRSWDYFPSQKENGDRREGVSTLSEEERSVKKRNGASLMLEKNSIKGMHLSRGESEAIFYFGKKTGEGEAIPTIRGERKYI